LGATAEAYQLGDISVSQQWVQVYGLIAEIIGVLLLGWEWFAAARQESRERALADAETEREERAATFRRMQTPNPAMERHVEMSASLQRRMTAERVSTVRRHYRGMRTRAVVLSLVLVMIGFALQLLGTLPGCCAQFGISPGG
jgi:hypothetical protein